MLVMSFLFSILFLGGWSGFSNLIFTQESYFAFYNEFLYDLLETDFIHSFIPTRTTSEFIDSILFSKNQTAETSILVIKSILVALLFISVRAVAPRYKYIQLIKLC